MQELRKKRIMAAAGYVILAAAVMIIQTGICPQLKIAGVMPSLLPVAAAVVAVYTDGVTGALFGALCGMLMDALIPNVSVWVYTAMLSLACGWVGSVSSWTKKGRILSSVFWSVIVLLFTGAVEVLVFGIIRGGGAGECAVQALKQALWSLVFAVPMDLIICPISKKLEVRISEFN